MFDHIERQFHILYHLISYDTSVCRDAAVEKHCSAFHNIHYIIIDSVKRCYRLRPKCCKRIFV